MVTGFVLLKVENSKMHEIAKALVNRSGVEEVHSVSNGVDLVLIMKLADEQVLKRVISEQIATVEGVTLSQVLVSSRNYSGYTIEDDEEFLCSI